MGIDVAEKNFHLLADMVTRAEQEGSRHLFDLAHIQLERLEMQYASYATKIQHEVDALRARITRGRDGSHHTKETTTFNGTTIAPGQTITATNTSYVLTGITVVGDEEFLILRDTTLHTIFKVPKRKLETLTNPEEITPLILQHPHNPALSRPSIPHIGKVPKRKLQEMRVKQKRRTQGVGYQSVQDIIEDTFVQHQDGTYPDWEFLASLPATGSVEVKNKNGSTTRSATMDALHILYPERYGLAVQHRFRPFQKKVRALVEQEKFTPQAGESITSLLERFVQHLSLMPKRNQ